MLSPAKHYHRISLLILFVILTAGNLLNAQSVSFSVNAPRQVIQGNKFSITYVLKNAEGRNLKFDDPGGCTRLFGPSTSTSFSQQWINGASSSSSTQEFAITYRADKPGKYSVGGASIEVNGKRYSTNGFAVEVLPPDKSVSNSQGQSQSVQIDDISTQASTKQVNSGDIFVRIILSKSQAYEQEAIVCTIKLYTKYQISQFMPTLQPSFNGFLIEELPITSALNDIERYNGENYMVAELKKCILYPQQSGKLTITSGNYDVTVVQYEQMRTMFGYTRVPVEKSLKVKSNQGTINISPLPQPRPAGFNGAVGEFTVSTSLSPSQFKTNEAATYTYVIKGSGNIKYLKNPVIDFPSQFEVYDPQSNVSAAPSGSNVSGTMKVEYTFVPQYVGEYSIPGTEFVYFNPSARKYVTLTTPKYDLKVAKGIGGPASSSVNKKEIEQKNKDILHIKSGDLNLKKDHTFMVSGYVYWLWYIIPLIIAVAVLVIYRKKIKERADIRLMKTKRANKIAKKRLKLAKQFMVNREQGKFYEEVLKALWGYLSDKLGIPGSMLNKENIAAELTNYGASAELTDKILSILDNCEFAQYAPSQSGSEMETVYNETGEAMNKLENTKRK